MNETKSACCGSGYLNGKDGCIKAHNATLCANREEFLFWDWFHPTEKVSKLAAETVFGGGINFVSPINFSQLASSYWWCLGHNKLFTTILYEITKLAYLNATLCFFVQKKYHICSSIPQNCIVCERVIRVAIYKRHQVIVLFE